MSEPDRTIPLRELRNDVSEVLRQVHEEGRNIRITVRGVAAADLVPVAGDRRWVARTTIEAIMAQGPLAKAFDDDVRDLMGSTIEEVEGLPSGGLERSWTD